MFLVIIFLVIFPIASSILSNLYPLFYPHGLLHPLSLPSMVSLRPEIGDGRSTFSREGRSKVPRASRENNKHLQLGQFGTWQVECGPQVMTDYHGEKHVFNPSKKKRLTKIKKQIHIQVWGQTCHLITIFSDKKTVFSGSHGQWGMSRLFSQVTQRRPPPSCPANPGRTQWRDATGKRQLGFPQSCHPAKRDDDGVSRLRKLKLSLELGMVIMVMMDFWDFNIF
jgi:hypothetical protein